jgi:hypothetical protein
MAAYYKRTSGSSLAKSALMATFLLCASNAAAQSVDKEPVAIVELGGAAEWNVKGGGSSFGPSAAVEVTPIENWLELEAGVTPLFGRQSKELDIDFLFKKPWTLSKRVEFMVGVGPEWVHATKYGKTTDSVALKPCWTLCSGRRRSTDLAGIWNRAMSTTSVVVVNSRSASLAGC